MEIVIFLIAVNVIVFIIPMVFTFGNGMYGSEDAFKSLGYKNNADIQDGEFYRLLTSNYLHADVTHLILNMLSLFNIGPFAVAVFGTLQFTIIYLVSGILGSVFSYFFNPYANSLGASGAVFGVVGALLAFSILSNESDLYSQLVLVIALNLGYGLLSGGRIDNWGHLGGFVGGFVLGLVFIVTGFARVSLKF